MFDVNSNWFAARVSELSDDDLCAVYEEVHDFRKTGILDGDAALRKLDREFREQFDSNSSLRLVEDAVLFEIGRRFYNAHEIRKNRYRDLKPGDHIWYADVDKGVLEKGTLESIYFDHGKVSSFCVKFESDGDVFDGSGLGTHYFDNEEEAKDALLNGS